MLINRDKKQGETKAIIIVNKRKTRLTKAKTVVNSFKRYYGYSGKIGGIKGK